MPSPSPERCDGSGAGSSTGVARPTPYSTGTGGGTGSTGTAGSDELVIDDVVSSLVEGREWHYRLWDYLGEEERRAFGPESVAHLRVLVHRTYFELRLRSVMLQMMALEAVNLALETIGEPACDSLATAARKARLKGLLGAGEYRVLTRILNAEGNASKHRRL